MQNLTQFKILSNGNLEIALTDEGKEEVKELHESWKSGKKDYYSTLFELLETPLCNGYSEVDANTIGALTDSMIITDNDGNYWWYPEYESRLELEDFIENGKLVLTKTN